MKKILLFGVFWLFTAAFFLTGCATSNQPSVGAQVTIPTCDSPYQYQAVVAASKKPLTGRMITVKVGGEVRQPGSYQLPENSTIFDAIIRAGGPTNYAAMHRVYVANIDGQKWRFNLQKQERPLNPPIVWYGEKNRMEDKTLEDDAIVIVPMSWC